MNLHRPRVEAWTHLMVGALPLAQAANGPSVVAPAASIDGVHDIRFPGTASDMRLSLLEASTGFSLAASLQTYDEATGLYNPVTVGGESSVVLSSVGQSATWLRCHQWVRLTLTPSMPGGLGRALISLVKGGRL